VQNKISYLTSLTGISSPAPALPADNAGSQPIAPTLSWGSVGNAASYSLRVSTASNCTNALFSASGLTATSQALSALCYATVYYWQTRTLNATGAQSDWSGVWSFTTVVAPPASPVLALPSNNAGNEPLSLSLSWGSTAGASSYEVEVSLSNTFSTTIFDQSGAAETSALITGLSNSTLYYWRVSASNDGGTSWSNAASFTTIIAAPASPALAAPASGAVNQPISLSLNWGAVNTAVTYEVQVSTDAGFGSVSVDQVGLTSASTTVGGLFNSTTYYWRANAANAGGASAWSTISSFSTIIAAPGVPALALPISGAINQPVTLSLVWGSISTATSYHLYVSTSSDFSSTVFSQGGLQGASQTLNGLANSTTYFWRVGAKDIGGISGWSGVWSFTTIIAAPGAPVLASPVNNAIGQQLCLTLTWGSTVTAVSYHVQVSTAADFSATVDDRANITDTGLMVTGLVPATLYYWRVGAANVGGVSAWSDSWIFTTVQQFKMAVAPSWNLVSMNIHACDSSFAGIVGSPASFLLVKDGSGNVYCPSWGIRDLSTFRTGQGYQVFSAQADTFIARGLAINTQSEPISLSRQWNLIGYLPAINQPIESELFWVASDLVIVKDNSGRIYWPDYGIDDIDTMKVGQGYQIYMNNDAVLTYDVSNYNKQAASVKKTLKLPDPRHFGMHANTGNNATLLARQVMINGKPVADSSEVGAYDSRGTLVGAGTVLRGVAAFAVWGAGSLAKAKDGCANNEAVSFRLWTNGQEYPLEFRATSGVGALYAQNRMFIGSLSVPASALITQFDLSRAYPNPFRGVVRIDFDVPCIAGVAESDISVNIYDMKGALVQQVARGKFAAGRHSVVWNGDGERSGSAGATLYVVRMRANNFDKRLKLIRMQ
jgi:hypothetical protein